MINQIKDNFNGLFLNKFSNLNLDEVVNVWHEECPYGSGGTYLVDCYASLKTDSRVVNRYSFAVSFQQGEFILHQLNGRAYPFIEECSA